MATLFTHPTAAAQWQALVAEAESAADCRLVEELESYLVFLLMRYTGRPDLTDNVLAVEYLNGMLASGHLQRDKLREVGDQCLLYSGLFPDQAERRRVRISYFVGLGRSAYQQLSTRFANSYAALYAHLSEDFVALMDVLHAVRKLGGARPCLAPIPAYELWCDTGSRQALQALRETSKGLPLAGVFTRDTRDIH